MSEKYRKINDHTLEVVQTLGDTSLDLGSYKTPSDFRLTRIFNFGTGQITTLARHFAGVASHYSSDHGAGMASSLQMQVQNFHELPSLFEVRAMHQKLRDAGGKPPPLDDILQPPAAQISGKPGLRTPKS